MPPTKKYICSFCARPFSRSEHKLRHERSHTQTKPFVCLCCNASFVRRDLLQRHLRNVHKLNPSSVQQSMTNSPPNSTSSPILPLPKNDAITASAIALPTSGTVTDNTHVPQSPKQITTTSIHNADSPRNNNSHNPIVHNHYRKSHDENDYIIQLLTISRSYQTLQLSIESHLPTLFFLYGTNHKLNIPVVDNESIYAVLCNGASFINMNDCIQLFTKSWNDGHNEDLKSLTILAYTYLNNHERLRHHLFPIDVLFEKLDEVLQKKIHNYDGSSKWEFNYWKIYNIQAQYCFKFNKVASSSHHEIFFNNIDVTVSGNSLKSWIEHLIKTSELPNNEDDLEILLNCITNELQNLKFNQDSSNLNKDELHNAIIMFNKHYIQNFILDSGNTMINSSTNNLNIVDQFEKLFLISKRHILLNVPQSFQDLIIDYVLIPHDDNHCHLLNLTLKEFELWNKINPFVNPYKYNHSASTSPDVHIKSWFNDLSFETINNDLGLVSYPLIFLGCLPIKLMKFNKISKGFEDSIIEIFLILLNLIIRFEKYSDNVVLKGVVYLILEMTSNNDLSNSSGSTPGTTSYSKSSDLSSIDKDLLIKNLFKILSNWLDFLNCNEIEVENLKHLFNSFCSPSSTRQTSVCSIDSVTNMESLRYSPSSHSTGTTSPSSSSNYKLFGGSTNLVQDGSGKIKLPPLNVMTSGLNHLINPVQNSNRGMKDMVKIRETAVQGFKF